MLNPVNKILSQHTHMYIATCATFKVTPTLATIVRLLAALNNSPFPLSRSIILLEVSFPCPFSARDNVL